MKKTVILVVITMFSIGLWSCTPEAIIEETGVQACCDNEGDVPPPPPPPTGNTGG